MNGTIFQIDLNSGTGYIQSGFEFIPFNYESFNKNLNTEFFIGDKVSFLLKYDNNGKSYAYEIDDPNIHEGLIIPDNHFKKIVFDHKIHKMIGKFELKSTWKTSISSAINEINEIFKTSNANFLKLGELETKLDSFGVTLYSYNATIGLYGIKKNFKNKEVAEQSLILANKKFLSIQNYCLLALKSLKSLRNFQKNEDKIITFLIHTIKNPLIFSSITLINLFIFSLKY